MQTINVYYSNLIKYDETDFLFPNERQKEIESCSAEKVKNQKYSAWKLLEFALLDFLKLPVSDANLIKTPSGKWTSDKCYFSIAHTGNAVFVAISSECVGIDAEKVKRLKLEIKDRILTDNEKEKTNDLYGNSLNEALLQKWTQKEAISKFLGSAVFSPKNIEVDDFFTKTKILSQFNEEYIICICGCDTPKLLLKAVSL